MWKIDKRTVPAFLTEYKRQPEANYKDLDKQKLRTFLLKDQGYVCCYCMQRIHDDSLKVKIEHFKSQDGFKKHVHSTNPLDYKNLFVCCLGNEGQKSQFQTCDTKKGNTELTSFNLLSTDFENIITYNKEGHIRSSDDKIDNELNEVLNLNNQSLKTNRESIRIGLFNSFEFLAKMNKLTKNTLLKYRNKYLSKNNDSPFTPFFSIIIYYLDKRIRQF